MNVVLSKKIAQTARFQSRYYTWGWFRTIFIRDRLVNLKSLVLSESLIKNITTSYRDEREMHAEFFGEKNS